MRNACVSSRAGNNQSEARNHRTGQANPRKSSTMRSRDSHHAQHASTSRARGRVDRIDKSVFRVVHHGHDKVTSAPAFANRRREQRPHARTAWHAEERGGDRAWCRKCSGNGRHRVLESATTHLACYSQPCAERRERNRCSVRGCRRRRGARSIARSPWLPKQRPRRGDDDHCISSQSVSDVTMADSSLGSRAAQCNWISSGHRRHHRSAWRRLHRHG